MPASDFQAVEVERRYWSLTDLPGSAGVTEPDSLTDLTNVIVDAEALIVECRLQRAERELCRMLFAVEPFLLQDDRRHAVVEQRQARVMSPGYDAENVHDEA